MLHEEAWARLDHPPCGEAHGGRLLNDTDADRPVHDHDQAMSLVNLVTSRQANPDIRSRDDGLPKEEFRLYDSWKDCSELALLYPVGG